MTPDLQEIARFHIQTSANQAELATRMTGPQANQFRENAEKHLRWGNELLELAESFKVFTKHTHPR
jgi:hypothetical protein